MIDDPPDSMAANSDAAEEASEEAIQSALGKLLSCVNEVYECREQFADDPFIQQIIINARQQAERAFSAAQAIIVSKTTPMTLPLAVRDDNLVAFMRESAEMTLTRRELEALALLRDGYTNKRAADRMGISPRTFECYRAEAKRKLGARNTAELVLKSLRLS